MSDGAFLAAVLLMAAMAFLTRIGGAALMSRVRRTPRLERFLAGLSASVVAALVASVLVQSDARSSIAVALAVATMLLTQSVVLAMLAGMLLAMAMTALSLV